MNGCGQQHHHIDNFVRGIETEMQYARLEEVTVITLLLHQAWEVRTRDGDAQRRWRGGEDKRRGGKTARKSVKPVRTGFIGFLLNRSVKFNFFKNSKK
jgi:hypothetical protein